MPTRGRRTPPAGPADGGAPHPPLRDPVRARRRRRRSVERASSSASSAPAASSPGTTPGLARSLAFTLIGVPLAAAALVVAAPPSLADAAERASLVWALYLAAMTLTVAHRGHRRRSRSAATAGIDGEWRPGALSTGVVWTGVWLWHRQMRRSAATAPTRLPDLPVELVRPLRARRRGGRRDRARSPPSSPRRSTLEVAGRRRRAGWCRCSRRSSGARSACCVWWWHWFRERGEACARRVRLRAAGHRDRRLRPRPPSSRSGRPCSCCCACCSTRDPTAEVLAPLDTALAAALVGGDRVGRITPGCSPPGRTETRRAGRLVVSAIALIGAPADSASIVNALLATFGPTLVDDDPRTLLLGGISALVVGVPAWWLAWRPGPSNAGGCRGPGSTRLSRGGLRRERRRRTRHPADHRVPRLRVRSSMSAARAASSSAFAPRSVSSAPRPSSSATTSRSGDAIARQPPRW